MLDSIYFKNIHVSDKVRLVIKDKIIIFDSRSGTKKKYITEGEDACTSNNIVLIKHSGIIYLHENGMKKF